MPAAAPTRIDKPWGYELVYAASSHYAGKILHIEKGRRLSRQYHRRKEETIYVQTGSMDLEVQEPGGEVLRLTLGPGQGYHLPPGTVHRMTALEDTDVLEASTPELDDVVRMEDDYGRA
jgi:quercetin dioxygenase-like cupin family protein